MTAIGAISACHDVSLVAAVLICWCCHVYCQGLAPDAEEGIPAAAALLETDVAVLPF